MAVASQSIFARQVAIVIAFVALALFVWKIAPVLMLGFAGIVLATAIRAVSTPLCRKLGIKEMWTVSMVFALMLVLLIGGAYLFGKQIESQTNELWTAIKDAALMVQEKVKATPIGSWLLLNADGAADPQAMTKAVKGTLSVFGGMADLILVLFVALYVAADPKTYRNGFLLLLPSGWRGKVGEALDASGVALRRWLIGQLGAMVVVGMLTAIGLWAVGVPMALALGILSGLLDFVPLIGPLLAAVPGILVAFSQGPEVALYAALIYLGVQFVEGNLIMPIAQKWAVHLPPVLGLLAIVAFGLVFGLVGILFAVPLTVVAVVLVKRLYVE